MWNIRILHSLCSDTNALEGVTHFYRADEQRYRICIVNGCKHERPPETAMLNHIPEPLLRQTLKCMTKAGR